MHVHNNYSAWSGEACMGVGDIGGVKLQQLQLRSACEGWSVQR